MGGAAAFEVGLAFESSFSSGAPGHVSNICFSQDMQTDSADAAFWQVEARRPETTDSDSLPEAPKQRPKHTSSHSFRCEGFGLKASRVDFSRSRDTKGMSFDFSKVLIMFNTGRSLAPFGSKGVYRAA